MPKDEKNVDIKKSLQKKKDENKALRKLLEEFKSKSINPKKEK